VKIKADFVTNSSSTCYIVSIPKEFKVSKKEFEEAVKRFTGYYPVEEMKNASEKEKIMRTMWDQIEDDIEYLARDWSVHIQYDDCEHLSWDDYDFNFRNMRIDILLMLVDKFIITSREINVSDGTSITSIPIRDFREAFLKIHDVELKETLQSMTEENTE
jgi:hypothetical protein